MGFCFQKKISERQNSCSPVDFTILRTCSLLKVIDSIRYEYRMKYFILGLSFSSNSFTLPVLLIKQEQQPEKLRVHLYRTSSLNVQAVGDHNFVITENSAIQQLKLRPQELTSESRKTIARICANGVSACTTVQAGTAGAVVDVDFALFTGEAKGARAIEIVDQVHTFTSIVTGIGSTFVNFNIALGASVTLKIEKKV